MAFSSSISRCCCRVSRSLWRNLFSKISGSSRVISCKCRISSRVTSNSRRKRSGEGWPVLLAPRPGRGGTFPGGTGDGGAGTTLRGRSALRRVSACGVKAGLTPERSARPKGRGWACSPRGGSGGADREGCSRSRSTVLPRNANYLMARIAVFSVWVGRLEGRRPTKKQVRHLGVPGLSVILVSFWRKDDQLASVSAAVASTGVVSAWLGSTRGGGMGPSCLTVR